jgi:hypothetical protein
VPLPLSAGAASLLRRSGIGVHPLDWRLPPIETWPIVVAFAQSWAGKALLFAVFAVLLKPLSGMWLELTIAAAAVSLAGRYRHYAALVATAVLLSRTPYWFNIEALETTIRLEGLERTIRTGYVLAGTLAACVPVAAAALWLTRRFRNHPLGRRPVLAQHIICAGLLGLAASQLLRGLPQVVLWSVTATFLAYFWFLAYALMDQRQRQPAPLLLHFATFHPFFASPSVVPMGKGAANWRSVEAATAEELAVTQLKALKLLAWAFFLKVLLWLFHRIVYDGIGVPPLEAAFETFLAGGDLSAPLGLASIVANFPEQLLVMALWGHVIIAVARLAGFRLLRNTWRPLSSRTIAEFWNRYFYYFKEILVQIYFYPTYVRWFKRHPRLRLAFATFMAAGVGNFFFHFILQNHRIAEYGLLETLILSQTYAFYCVLLVAGIVLSQLRARRPDPNAGWWRGQLVPSLGVALFYAFLSFFDGPQRHVDLTHHFAFLFHVFGVDSWIQATG